MKLIPLVSIGVKRDGKTIHPTIGKAFDFTAEEVSDLDKLSAQTKNDYYRLPINEAPEAVTTTAPEAAVTPATAPQGRGGKKAKQTEEKAAEAPADASENTSGADPEL